MFPFIRINEQFLLPTYMVVLSLTYCLALVFVFFRAGSDDDGARRNTALDIALAIMVGGFLGARLFHVAYELPSFYWENPGEIIKFWRGGFVYYGGFIGAFLLTWAYLRYRRLSFLEWGDFYAPVLSLGYALGRVGCFLNGCCFGDFCDLPWAVEFTYPGLPPGLRHPTQLYATAYELGVFGFILGFEMLARRRNRKLAPGALFFTWLVLHAAGRIFMEAFRADDRGSALLGLSISTWISAVLIAVGIIGSLRAGSYKFRRP